MSAKKTQSGLDIDLGNQCSRVAYDWAKKTFTTREGRMGMPLPGLDGSFSNLMDFGKVRIAMSSDGIGTKSELAERTGIFNTLGYDLVAMTVDDLAANGVEPVCLSNILDVDNLDADIVDALMSGLHDASVLAEVAVTGGEIAELGNRIGGYGEGMHFNWGATAIGMLPDTVEPVTGKGVVPGNVVITLASDGFRSNGFSLIRRVMEKTFGEKWHDAPGLEGRRWGEWLLTPCRIYSPLVTALRKAGVELEAVAHITGGGVEDNLARMLKTSGYGARLDNLFAPHPFMVEVQRLGDVSEEQAYRLWNMGNGMLLVVPEEDVPKALELAEKKGFRAQVGGVITSSATIEIVTSGVSPTTLIRNVRETEE